MENSPLIFHIAGITDLYKEQLMVKLKSLNKYVIYNLDEETDKIYKLKEIQDKLKDINKVKLETKRKVEAEVNTIWVSKLNEYIKKNSQDHVYGIIFIGNIINIKFLRSKIILPAFQKFFLKVDLHQNAKDIIKYNLKKYHNDIVNGVFPLNYINLEFLKNTREQLQNSYKKLQYNVIPLNKIIYYFQRGINEKKPELLYVVLKEEHDKVIDSNKKISGYAEDWIALSCMAKGIDRGYNDGIAYIKETVKNAYKNLEIDVYIYVVSSNNFLAVKNSDMKFVTERPVKIIKSMKIINVLSKLKELKIHLR
jgi:hypothetical protein